MHKKVLFNFLFRAATRRNFQRQLAITSLVLLTANIANAVDFGWQELPGGGIEYLVQVEPSLVDSFRQGGFSSDIPPGLRDVRRIRIVVGEAQLPNQGNLDGPRTSKAALPTDDTQPKPADPPSEKAETAGQNLRGELNSPDEHAAAAAPSSTFGNPPAEEKTANSKSPPALLNPSNLLSAMPFFQPGRSQSTAPTNPASPQPPENRETTNQTAAQTAPVDSTRSADKFERPEIGSDARPRAGNDPAAGYMEVNAARPQSAVAPDATEPTSKPWLPLMIALLALFLSLGANVYLVWIHQGVRAKYRAVVDRQRSELAAV